MSDRYTVFAENFSPSMIAESGQCFRMNRMEEKLFSVTAGNRYVTVSQKACNEFEFSCTEKEFTDFWRGYFDLDADYSAYTKAVLPEDRYMADAVSAGEGLRILRQDPWEMLITFLLSQRKAIPLIKRSVEQLCERFGEEIGENIYAFPTPIRLAAASEEELAVCGLGYRTKYVMRAATLAADGKLPFESWENLPDEELKEKLLSLYGVGIKVASCIMLFGYHRLDTVPVDVWMERVAEEHYNGQFPYSGEGSYAGVLQQYVFEYIRKQSGVK